MRGGGGEGDPETNGFYEILSNLISDVSIPHEEASIVVKYFY